MDIWFILVNLATWTLTTLLCVFSHEVTVKVSDLKPCEEDERVCVTDLRECGPRPPSSIQKALNISCYYEMSHKSMTCEWSQSNSNTESDASLIFRSNYKIYSCQGIFNPAAVLHITARMKDFMVGWEIWSQPHTVVLYEIDKPSCPVLTALRSTEDSVVVTWRSSGDGGCRLRYRVNSTHTWTQTPDSLPSYEDETLTYTIRSLVPFTLYRAAVACSSESTIWSDWSLDVTARTLDRVPSQPPEVCYRVEKTNSAASVQLHLMWKDLQDARSRVVGYQLIYKPVKKKQQLQERLIQNITEVTALLVVEEGNYTVTLSAFNTAGYGPAAHLNINTHRQGTLPPVRNLWVSSSFPDVKGLLVQWESSVSFVPPSSSSSSVRPVNHFAVQWRSVSHPFNPHWTTVDGLTTSTLIQEVDPDESYLISVFPVYKQQCGPAQSLPASLQQGALMEVVRLKVASVTKTTVTVAWAWQRKSGPIRVNQYRVTLRKDSEEQTLSLWPDQWQLTILNLKPNTEYSLLLLADNVSRSIIPVRTDFDEIAAVATATPLLLLAVTMLVISILCRTVYKSYFFPLISSPRGSTAGQWLMDPKPKKSAKKNILDIEDFQVKEKNVITIAPNTNKSMEEHILDIEDFQVTEKNLFAFFSDKEFISEAKICFTQIVAESERDTSHQKMTCEEDYVVSSSSPEEMGTGQTDSRSRLLCETEYIAI